MPNQYTPGSFSPAGWRIDLQPTPPAYTAWVTKVPRSIQSASNNGGFSFSYDGTPTPVKRRHMFIALPADAPINVAFTGFTDILSGGYLVPSTQLYNGPNIGINLGVQTILNLGPALLRRSTGNQLSGYGNIAGIQIGAQTLVDGVFDVSYTSGVVLGGSANDSISGTSYGIGSGAIENYGIIKLAAGSDAIYASANTSGFGGYGLINWGVIDTGTNGKRDRADTITGIGNTVGISNSTGLINASQEPTILTGADNDIIWGQSNQGNSGIRNDGLVNMGSGDDLYKSTLRSDTSVTSLFSGSGTVVMGSGNDVVQGFGTGTFFGDGLGEVRQARLKGKTLVNYDSLYVIDGSSYTVADFSATGNLGQTIHGFTISDGSSTMTVFGFEAIGTNAGNLVQLQAGTFDFSGTQPS